MEEPSLFSVGQTAHSNLFHHGETTYRVGRLSGNPTAVLQKKVVCSPPEPVRHVHGAARADAGPLGQLPHPHPVGARVAHRGLQLRARLQRGRLVQARAQQGTQDFTQLGTFHWLSFKFRVDNDHDNQRPKNRPLNLG